MATCLLLLLRCIMKLNRFGKSGVAILGTRNCQCCGSTFEVTSDQPNKKFCSRSCVGRRPGTRVTKPCEHCGEPFESDRIKNRRFCSKTCSMSSRWADKEIRARYESSMANKSETQVRVASERMKRMNKDEVFRKKSDDAKRGRPFAGVRGGNGHITPEQKALAEATGYAMEHPVRTGNPRWRCALLDLANADLKIAVELDGHSHSLKAQKSRDAKKGLMLAGLGWTMLRFSNEQVRSNLHEVVRLIRECESRIRSCSPLKAS
jgi:endogenous inhibitor of DNA gyrase (YacG/DUF329 family)